MAETKIYISDDVDKKFREIAMKRFGYGRGSISKAVEEAIVQWLIKEDKINTNLQLILNAAKEDNNVIAVIIFGSYIRKESSYKDIDIQIFIKENANHFDILSRYMHIVNATEDRTFDISILNDMPLYIKTKALSEGSIIYVKDKNALYDYSIKVMKEWNEFEPRLNIMLSR